MHFVQSKINKLRLPKGWSADKIEIGIPVVTNEKELIGVKNIGDTILPSGEFGRTCSINAYGYEELDKTKPKERRYVSTIDIYPYGNTDAPKQYVDIYKYCWQKRDVPPIGIELSLVKGSDEKEYITVNLNEEIRNNFLKEAVNVVLEIFGHCYIFEKKIYISPSRRRCNWVILPPGEKPSQHIANILKQQGQEKERTFDVERLRYLEKYKVNEIVEGVNGFSGYYAYLFENYCFLESAFYGNATYIIKRENWELLSQKTKSELFSENKVVQKIVHMKSWFYRIREAIKTLEKQ